MTSGPKDCRNQEGLTAHLLEVSATLAKFDVLHSETLDVLRSEAFDAVVSAPGPDGCLITLMESGSFFRTLVIQMQEGVASIDARGTIVYANPRFAELLALPLSQLMGRTLPELTAPGGQPTVRRLLAQAAGGSARAEFDLLRADGRVVPVSLSAAPIGGEQGEICLVVMDQTEQTEQHTTEIKLRVAEESSRSAFEQAPIGMAVVGLDGRLERVNAAFAAITGRPEVELLGASLLSLLSLLDRTILPAKLKELRTGEHDWKAREIRYQDAAGRGVWVSESSALVRDPDGRPHHILLQVEDITAEHEAQEALAYQAFHDPLTGLHNRAWILDILPVDLRAAKRLGHSVGALFVDLDNFKVVNDSLGHAAGDEVLATVADRIVAGLRPGDRVGRFGGDEFVIVVQDVQDVLDVERCAERVSASIAVDLQVRGHRIVPTASIGIATSTSSSTPESLLRDADSALSRAKAKGRARWHFFDEAMHAQALARLTVEDELREAITAGEFVTYYQPIVALVDAHVVGHEALVRWAHPTRGLLSPGEFLEVAEDTGLISAIGAQVLDQVCALLAARPDLPGPISVNVSAVQLAAPGWLDSVRDTLAAHRVDPGRVVIEVTETAVLSLVDSARVALETLRGLGVGIHLDDFGTGYSSISVLRDLPVTGVKLDLRFVHDLTEGDSQANALARGVSGLVHGMHLTGIAEGIETELQADILRAQGWECGQGYYFGRPAATPVT